MSKLLKVVFILIAFFLTWQIMRAIIGPLNFGQYIIAIILVLILFIFSIFITGRIKLGFMEHIEIEEVFPDEEDKDSDTLNQ